VRLAFLDVLQPEQHHPAQRSELWAGSGAIAPGRYAPVAHEQGLNGWLRRYSGLLALLAVLATCLLVGLLVGHWVTQGKATGKQVVEIKGLSSAPAAASASPTSTAPAATPAGSTPSSTSAAEAAEAKEAAKETAAEKAPPPPPVKVKPQTIKKLSNSKGAQHQQEINKLIEGGKPIETG
jgi:hypothetical protein